jgi:hypothetical protein
MLLEFGITTWDVEVAMELGGIPGVMVYLFRNKYSGLSNAGNKLWDGSNLINFRDLSNMESIL